MSSVFPKLRLVYFPVRARAECARMIMAYGDIPYSDEDCASFFGMSFADAKSCGKLPFGQLPVLQIDEKDPLIAQSGSINRYLASLVAKPGFLPDDKAALAYCDMIHETAQDIARINPIVNKFRGEQFEAEKQEYFTNTLPPKLEALALQLASKTFFCGDSVTYADFAVYHQFDLCRLIQPGIFEKYENIRQWMARVEKLPGVSNYLTKRPECVGIGVDPKLKPKC